MAKITDVFVTGTMANIVLYRRMGTNCSRMKRPHIRQTEPTKIRGMNFGIAARAAKGLRSGLKTVMPNPTDRSMQSRFSGAIAKWLALQSASTLPSCSDAPYIGSFTFTNSATFKERFKVPVTISQPEADIITVSIDAFVPALNIAAPAGTVSVNCIITVVGCLLAVGGTTGSETHCFTFLYNDIVLPAQVFNFHVPMPKGSLTVTASRLIYLRAKNNELVAVTEPDFIPADVINARYIA